MNPFLNKRIKNKENQYQPAKNQVLNYQNNSNNKNYYSSLIHSYTKKNPNENEEKIYIKSNKNSEKQSFESLKEPSNTNENNRDNNYWENKISDYNESPFNSNEYFNNYKYYEPSLSIYKSLPLPKNNSPQIQKNENINNKKYKNLPVPQNNEYTKYNPNFFNQRKKIITKKFNNNNELTFNNISNNNFLPKRTINTINNSKYGDLLKKNFFYENNLPTHYYDSFNNNFINYLSQNNYNEDSFNNEEANEENNSHSNSNIFQINKLTIYDIRKKKSLTDGQTFFIKKAENSENYQFFESKREKSDKKNLNKINKNIKSDKKDEKNKNDDNNESIYLENDDNDEIINNHNFIVIKSPSIVNKKNEENENKVNLDNYQYKETKVKGPDNYKPVMKLRIGINGEKFYEKFVPEKKVIKYTYEPVCKIINNKNMNNVGFKKVVSHYHSGIRRKYKKINPDLLTKPAVNVIISNNSFDYKNNYIDNINDSNKKYINDNDNFNEEKKAKI